MKWIKQDIQDTSSDERRPFEIQMHLIFAGGIFLTVSGFLTGYFWGIRSSVEQLSMQLDQEAFADQISASLIPMHDSSTDEQLSAEPEAAASQGGESEPTSQEQEYVSEQSYLRTYYAQLAGFGSKRAAQRFAQKLEKQDIPVVINAVHSRNNRGKSVTWYQVVTESYSTKEELEALVERLKETEKLKDPQIVHC